MPMSDTLQLRQQVWAQYWASGAAHSCGTSYGERYGGAIAAFWRQIHDDTPAGSRLLDVATGSGAIPRLWRSWRGTDAWDAVDLVASAPSWAAEAGPWLRFHAGVRAESLPFPASSFDLVTSQYGLEYCDLALAVPEMLRVLAPGGAVALVLHHAASRPVAMARADLSHLDWALGPDGLIGACAGMLGPAAEATTPQGRARLAQDPAAEAARLRFNAAQDALHQRANAHDGADMLGDVQGAVAALLDMSMQQGAPAARSRLDAWLQGMAQHRWRQEELCAHALDDGAIQALAAELASAGLRVDLTALEDGPHLMGWALRGMAR